MSVMCKKERDGLIRLEFSSPYVSMRAKECSVIETRIIDGTTYSSTSTQSRYKNHVNMTVNRSLYNSQDLLWCSQVCSALLGYPLDVYTRPQLNYRISTTNTNKSGVKYFSRVRVIRRISAIADDSGTRCDC